MPDDIFANAEVTRMGHPVDLEDLCKNNWCPKMKKPENVIGKHLIRNTAFSGSDFVLAHGFRIG